MKISLLNSLYATNETNLSTYPRTPSGKGLRPSFRPFCTIFLKPHEAGAEILCDGAHRRLKKIRDFLGDSRRGVKTKRPAQNTKISVNTSGKAPERFLSGTYAADEYRI